MATNKEDDAKREDVNSETATTTTATTKSQKANNPQNEKEKEPQEQQQNVGTNESDAEEGDDEDYKPEEDSNAEADDDDMQVADDGLGWKSTPLPPSKRKAVDMAFEQLFGYEWGTEFALDENTMKSDASRQLVSMFGPTVAARIIGQPIGKRRKMNHATEIVNRTTTQQRSPSDRPNEVVLLSKPQMTTETKMFAGQVVTVQRQPQDSSTQKGLKNSTAANNTSKLDNVLAQLAGPSKISTVQKTSNDWEQFKQTDQQLQEDLERKAQSKDAFLVKQDFLNRVDQRRFEIEKEERDRDRAKRGK